MKERKAIYVIFIILVILGIIYNVVSNIISSPYFNTYLRHKIINSINSEEVKKIDFKGVKVIGFPFILGIEDVELKFQDKNIKLDIFSQELGVSFGFFSNYHKESFNISEINLKNAVLKIEELNNDKKEKSKLDWKKELSKHLNGMKVSKDVYLYGLHLVNTQINFTNKQSLLVKDLSIESRRNRLYYDIELENIILSDQKEINYFKTSGKLASNTLEVNELGVRRDFSQLKMSGKVKKIFSKNPELSFNIVGKALVDELLPLKDISNHGLSGLMKFNAKASGDMTNPKVAVELILEETMSKYLNTKKAYFDIEVLDKIVYVQKALLKNQEGEVYTNEKQKLYDINTGEVFPEKIVLKLKKMPLKAALESIPDVRDKLDGVVDGVLQIGVKSEGVTVKILKGNFHDLSLDIDGEILKIKKLYLINSLFDYNFENEKLVVKGSIDQGAGLSKIYGYMSPKKIDIKTKNLSINLNDFYHILDFPIKGSSKVNLFVRGTTSGPIIELETESKDLKFAGFYLGNNDGEIIIDLNRNKLRFPKVSGFVGKGAYEGGATINLLDNSVAGNFNIKDFSINELKKSHAPVLEAVPEYYWDYTVGKVSGMYDISGKLSLEKLVVKGKYRSKNLKFFFQDFDDVKSSLLYKDLNLDINQVEAITGKAKIVGGMKYIDRSNKFSFNFNAENFTTKDLTFYNDLNSGFFSRINFGINGSFDDLNSGYELDMKFVDSKMLSKPFDDSKFMINYKNGVYNYNLNFAKDIVKSSGEVFEAGGSKNSKIEILTNIKNWHPILNLFATYDISYPYLEGSFRSKHLVSFDYTDPNLFDLSSRFDEFTFSHRDINYLLREPGVIEITDGNINKWSIILQDDFLPFMESKGKGSYKDGYQISNTARINLNKVSKILNSDLDFSGNVDVTNVFKGKMLKYSMSTDIEADSFNCGNISWPDSIKNAELKINLKDEKLTIKKFKSDFGEGDITLKGNVDIGYDISPNLELEFNNSRVNINEKSYVVLNGKTGIISKKRPFIMSGRVNIEGGEIFDEFEKFIGEESEIIAKKIQFLPDDIKNLEPSWFELSIDSSIGKPIHIKNSVAEKYLIGSFRITGNEVDPILEGRVEVDKSKNNVVLLNNNEIVTNKLVMQFDSENSYTNPNIEYEGETLISDYKIFISSYGLFEDLTFDFKSDPFQERSSILSLIAFGYADDSTTKDLSDDQREQIASAGIGSFIFNTLKINETLKKTLGLSLNLDTEFIESTDSYLSGRSQGTTSRSNVRTATNIKISRKLTDKIKVDLSQTVLGDSGQANKVDIDYQLGKNIALEAIYESSQESQGQTTTGNQTDSSFGADLKFRWTFE